MHFVAPNTFPIWDSKIYRFVFEKKPYQYRVSDISAYRHYNGIVHDIIDKNGFQEFHESVNRKTGYPVSPVRAVELVMFLNV